MTEPARGVLRRDLGLPQSTALAVTNMIGIGPFITISLMLGTMGGPQALLGLALGALLAFCDGLVWAELGTAMPQAGGTYNYLRTAYGAESWGRWLSFLVVWQVIFSAPLSVASGSIGFAKYLTYLFPSLAEGGVRWVAAAVPLLLTFLLYRRIRAVGTISLVLLAGVLAGCLWIIGSGLPHVDPAKIFDFPADSFQLTKLSFWDGLGGATRYALYIYFGYYNVCFLAGEIRNPGRVVPRAMLVSIAVVAVIYFLLNSSILSVVPWREAMESEYIASTYMERLYGSWAGGLMTVLILWIAFSSVFSVLLGYTRFPFRAAADDNFFRAFARLHPKGDFPTVSLVVMGLIASVFSFLDLREVIGSLIATRVLLLFLPQTVAFFLLRRTKPEMPRPFRTWLYPLPGIISILGWLGVLASSERRALLFALVIFAVGTGLFLARARQRREWPWWPVQSASDVYG